MMVKNTQYCYVGDYLCYRNVSHKNVWITKVKEDTSDFIQVNDITAIEAGVETLYTHRVSQRLDIGLMLDRTDDLEYI